MARDEKQDLPLDDDEDRPPYDRIPNVSSDPMHQPQSGTEKEGVSPDPEEVEKANREHPDPDRYKPGK